MPPSASSFVVDPNGYLFKLPSLGLPDPAGEWVRVCGAIGSRDEAIRLVGDHKAADAPLRRIDGKYGIKELEHDGSIWFFPTSYLPQFRAQFTARPQLFSINV